MDPTQQLRSPAPDGIATNEHSHSDSIRKVVAASTVGTIVEYYDFAVYGYLSAAIGAAFFAQSGDATSALLASLATFAVAFLVRPIGAVIFGHIGDKLGRRQSLALTLLVMTGASILIGILPGYMTVGIAATVGLVVLRILQGLSTGGEQGAAYCFVGEHADPKQRGFLIGIIAMGVVVGTLLASGVVALLSALITQDAMNSWGWRIPFLLAAPIGAVGLYIRMKLEDSPVFRHAQDKADVVSLPMKEVFRSHTGAIIRCIGLTTASVAGYFIVFVYLAIYMEKNLHHDVATAVASTTVCLFVAAASMLYFARLQDRFGRKPLVLGLTLALAVLGWPLIMLLGSSSLPVVFMAHSALGLIVGGYMPVCNTTLTEIFPTPVRATGMGIGFNLANVIAGGTAPYVVAQIGAWFPSTIVPIPVLFLAFWGLVSFVAGLTLKPTSGLSYAEIDRNLTSRVDLRTPRIQH